MKEAIKNKEKEIKDFREGRCWASPEVIIAAENELKNLLEEEELYWRVRSREEWLKGGDRNSKWFHSKASMRRKRNEIKGLTNKNGSWVESEEELEVVAVEYFRNLFRFSNPSPECIKEVTNSIQSRVTEDQNLMLDRDFSKEEIEIAVKSMGPSKALGPDGAHAMFYQKYWEVIGKDTTNMCLRILNQEGEMDSLNETLITLIPKTNDPKHMSEFRPISLCNVAYKITAKALANRLKRILDSIISPTQGAFVPGRQITDNVFVGYECIHALNSKRKGKEGTIALKLDMSKAYDKIEWPYIMEVMNRMGFSERWRKWIMCYISTVSYSILLNGIPSVEFRPSRGLKQGDPLSPYLFLMCAEGFSTLLNREESLSNLSGFRINKFCPPLTHLFFCRGQFNFR